MNLPFLGKKKEDKEYFLALLLSSNEVRSILFEKTGENLSVLGSHSEDFAEQLDTLSRDRLIELSDMVISEVERKLPEGSSLQKAIFSVPDRWIEDGKITQEHLAKLKELCDALQLKAVGFIVSMEAIIAYLHKKEGVPVTAIFIEVGKKHVTLSLVKNGNILSVSEEEIEEDAVITVEKILSTQEELEILPAKIIVLPFEHAKRIQQEFLSYSWSKSIQFLHIPQVEVLPSEVEAQAVISGVAVQMGFNTLPQINLQKLEKSSEDVVVAVNEQEENKTNEKEDIDNGPGEFEKESNKEEMGSVAAAESLGFFKDIDIAKKQTEKHELENIQEISVNNGKNIKEEDSSMGNHPTHALSVNNLPPLPHVSFPGIKFKIPRVSLRGKSMVWYPILGVFLFVLLIVSYYYFFEKAQVILVLSKKDITKNVSVTFSQEKQTSAQDSVVHIEELAVQVDGKEEQSTTGKKETGDKAKGEVTVYNKTEESKTFEKGVIVIGANNLEFSLLEDVKVASTSSFSTTFSNAKGKVEALKFGKEYNLPSGTNFQIKGQSTSDFFGKNDSAFAGGTKKEITVVSEDDISSLQSKVISTLSKKAQNDIASKIGQDSQILATPLDYSFDEKSFSKKAGDAADAVSLTATITYKMGSYKKSDLIILAKDITGRDAPANYVYSGKDSEIKVEDIVDNEANFNGKIVFSSVFLPQINNEGIGNKVSGKSVQKAQELIESDGVASVTIIFTRSLPFFPNILPFNKKNIEVVTQTQ